MSEASELPKRKRTRLEDYDYSSSGVYFVTICTKDKRRILWRKYYKDEAVKFGDIRFNIKLSEVCRGEPCSPVQYENFNISFLSKIGKIVNNSILEIPRRYNNVIVDKYVIMPNHIHMIIVIDNECESCGRTRFAPTLSRIVKQTKGKVTKQIGYSIWHRSFYDRIIRNRDEYEKIWKYIDENPLKWEEDEYYC